MSTLSPPKNNYMKYYRVIRYFIKKKYNLTQADLEMLYFLHDEEYFSKAIFKKYNDIMTWDKNRFQRLIKQGWIVKFRNHNNTRKALYQLSYKSINVIRSVYAKLSGEVMPTSNKGNPLFRGNLSTKDTAYKNMIVEMNNFIKRQRHPFLG